MAAKKDKVDWGKAPASPKPKPPPLDPVSPNIEAGDPMWTEGDLDPFGMGKDIAGSESLSSNPAVTASAEAPRNPNGKLAARKEAGRERLANRGKPSPPVDEQVAEPPVATQRRRPRDQTPRKLAVRGKRKNSGGFAKLKGTSGFFGIQGNKSGKAERAEKRSQRAGRSSKGSRGSGGDDVVQLLADIRELLAANHLLLKASMES